MYHCTQVGKVSTKGVARTTSSGMKPGTLELPLAPMIGCIATAPRNDEAFINSIDSKWSGALPATFLYARDGHRAASFIGATEIAKIEAKVNKLR